MQQLQYMKDMIIERLNQRLKTGVVKNIFFVVGQVHMEPVELESNPPTPMATEVQGSGHNEDFLESVQDPEIRQAFKRLLKGYSRHKRKD
jgi:hypothetical protein